MSGTIQLLNMGSGMGSKGAADKMSAINKLTATAVRNLDRRGYYGDGRGLWLQVSKWGSKSWVFRFTLNGRSREMGLGPVSLQRNDGGVSLAEAREAADACCKLLRQGIDPIEHRKQEQQQRALNAARAITFKQAAEAYIEAHKDGWKNPKHGAQWAATLGTYAYPIFGKLPVADVDTALVLKALRPIWTTKAETARRLRGRIESVLDWARVRGYRKGENPARWKGHLDKLLPPQQRVHKVRHHPALPYSEVGEFMAQLRALSSISARALEFTILTACRTSEVIGATWDEIDWQAKVWTVPAARMKAAVDHEVPLSDVALELLKALPKEAGNPFIFPGAREGKPLSNMAMLQCLRDLRPGLTVHGFRSTFRDWAGECTNFPREIAEAALAHTIKDKVEAAYRRGTALQKRRHLMAAWARYCGTRPAKGGKVVQLSEKVG